MSRTNEDHPGAYALECATTARRTLLSWFECWTPPRRTRLADRGILHCQQGTWTIASKRFPQKDSMECLSWIRKEAREDLMVWGIKQIYYRKERKVHGYPKSYISISLLSDSITWISKDYNGSVAICCRELVHYCWVRYLGLRASTLLLL